MTEVESSDMNFGPLLSGQCDLMLSIPGADAIVGIEDQVTLTAPYYGTGFELVPDDGKLDEDSVVAVRANTVAHVVIDARGHNWTMQPDSAAIVAAVANGTADVGLVWGPELALVDTDLQHNSSYQPPRILRWNQHAVARAEDQELITAVNGAFADIADEIITLLRAHDIPAHPPYDQTHQQEALRAL